MAPLNANSGNDVYKEVTTTGPVGYFERVKNAFAGIIIGILLFLGAFVVLFMNEFKTDMSKVAQSATQIDATQMAPADMNGKLVSLSGKITSDKLLSDDGYIKEGSYISVQRIVEMYAWDENEKTDTKTNPDKSTTKTTTYSYVKKWTDTPKSTASFKEPTGHQNPPKAIEDFTNYLPSASIGVYSINLAELKPPPYQDLKLNDQIVLPDYLPLAPQTPVVGQQPLPPLAPGMVNTTNAPSAQPVVPQPAPATATTSTVMNKPVLLNSYLYMGKGTLTAPEVGDIRISYKIFPADVDVTLLGKFNGQTIVKWTDAKGNDSLFRLFQGSYEDAVGTLKAEHNAWTWGLRILGFLMMVIGLNMIFAPISAILSFIPFINNISSSIISLVIFIVSVILSLVTILVAVIVKNIVLLITLGIIILLAIVALIVIGAVMFSKYSAVPKE